MAAPRKKAASKKKSPKAASARPKGGRAAPAKLGKRRVRPGRARPGSDAERALLATDVKLGSPAKAVKGKKIVEAPAPPAGRPEGLTYDPPVTSPAFAIEAARLLRDLNCTEIVALDVKGLSPLADYLVVASGTSDRQMSTVATAVSHLARERGEPIKSAATDTRTTWCVVDCIDTVVHIFEPTTRTYYDVENMHDGAKKLDWERGAPARGAGATRLMRGTAGDADDDSDEGTEAAGATDESIAEARDEAAERSRQARERARARTRRTTE
ncbi:hypothetical protein BH11PLA1_BH11PLA1_19790 [soil metagenome]